MPGTTGRRFVTIKGLRVMPDGSLWVSGDFDRALHIAADGSIIESVRDERPGSRVTLPMVAAGRYFFGAAALDPRDRSVFIWAFYWDAGVVGYTFPVLSTPTGYYFDPFAAVWVVDYGSMALHRYSRVVEGVEQWSVMGRLIGRDRAWGEDASLITSERGGAIRRVLPTGAVAWSVTFEGILGEPTSAYSTGYAITLDLDGIAYVRAVEGFGNNYIISVQTDVLPPMSGQCSSSTCSARRNNWFGSP